MRVAVLGTVAALLLWLGSTLAKVVALATTALVMGGTTNPLSVPQQPQGFVDGYTADARNRYINHPSTNCNAGCTVVGAVTPEQFVPVFGNLTFNQSVAQGRQNLDNCLRGLADCTFTGTFPQAGTTTAALVDDIYRVFGYSQSATIVNLEKRNLVANPPAGNPEISFDVIGNPNRPNGGFLARFFEGFTIPFLDVTFSGPMPTDTPYQTDDYTRQYDGWSDGPVNFLNLVADLNALMGVAFLHGNYFLPDTQQPNFGQPILQDTFGDTSYYLIPTETLPLISWMNFVPYVGPFFAAMWDAPLRVFVESAYDRTSSPGQPIGWNPFYSRNPLLVIIDLIIAMPTGWDDAISQAVGEPSFRPFFTTPAGPYGVGGPPVTMNPAVNQQEGVSADAVEGVTAGNALADADSGPPVAETPEVVPPPAETPDAEPTAGEPPDAEPAADPTLEEPPAAQAPDADDVSAPPAIEPLKSKARNQIRLERPQPDDPATSAPRDSGAPGTQDSSKADRDDTTPETDAPDGGDPAPGTGPTGDSDGKVA